MRIATNWIHQQSVNAMLNQQSSLAHTQLQVSTGRRILTPADDPVGAARAVDLSSFVNANEQYTRNIDFANSRLAPEESSLAAAGEGVAFGGGAIALTMLFTIGLAVGLFVLLPLLGLALWFFLGPRAGKSG